MKENANKKPVKPKAEPTAAQKEIKSLQEIASADRSQQQKARLDQLLQQERRDRFIRLLPKRMNKAIKALETVSACANRNGYSYTEEESQKIIAGLSDAIDGVKKAYSDKPKDGNVWSL